MKAEILTIGDEVLAGNIVDTNTTYLAEQLWLNGLFVSYHSAVRDISEDIVKALALAASRADFIFVTGGLGPTMDDLTMAAASEFFGKKLICDEVVLNHLENLYKSWGRIPTENNKRQALIPEGAKAFLNYNGTAPGVVCEHNSKVFYFMPGVPKEMKALFSQQVLPDMLKRQPTKVAFKSILLKCFGAAESVLDGKLKDLYSSDLAIDDVRIGFRVSYPETFIKLSAWAKSDILAEKKLEQVTQLVKSRVGEAYYGMNEDTLESVVGTLLINAGQTVAIAESCTGGLLGNRLTNIAGSSAYFLGGIISYSNDVKEKSLSVSPATLVGKGAVSYDCACEMAVGVRRAIGSDFGVSITGIAGPGGGTPEKPLGLVYIGLATASGVTVKEYRLPQGRDQFKAMVTSLALNWLRKELLA